MRRHKERGQGSVYYILAIGMLSVAVLAGATMLKSGVSGSMSGDGNTFAAVQKQSAHNAGLGHWVTETVTVTPGYYQTETVMTSAGHWTNVCGYQLVYSGNPAEGDTWEYVCNQQWVPPQYTTEQVWIPPVTKQEQVWVAD